MARAALGVELRAVPELNHLDAFAAARGAEATPLRASQGGSWPTLSQSGCSCWVAASSARETELGDDNAAACRFTYP
jgi:hypothetical protein